MKITLTERGFARAEFVDSGGEGCSIQDSSSAEEPKVWLGADVARMHLTQDQARDLVLLLDRFVHYGTIDREPG